MKDCNKNLTNTNCVDVNAPLTAQNVQNIANRLALIALKTIHAKSGDDYILDLRRKLIKYIRTNYAPEYITEASDLPSVAYNILKDYMGKSINDDSDVLYTSGKNKGKPITIKILALRAVNTYVLGEKKRVCKKVALDYVDSNGNLKYITPPDYLRCDTIYDFKRVYTLLKLMQLTPTQKRVVKYIMQGLNHSEISRVMGISRPTVINHVNNIREKAKKVIADIKQKLKK